MVDYILKLESKYSLKLDLLETELNEGNTSSSDVLLSVKLITS
jgi:hypothetical protein